MWSARGCGLIDPREAGAGAAFDEAPAKGAQWTQRRHGASRGPGGGPRMTDNPLDRFTKQRDFLIGIDSDGCAFDTMEIKHKECFIPAFVKHMRLQPVSKYAREACEFVNLYSKWRGANRFPAYLKALELLQDRPEVKARGARVPELKGLRDWAARETKLGNPTLKAEVERTHDPDLELTLRWSVAVNEAIDCMVHSIPPFPYVRASLERLAALADMIVCSATPQKALEKEWA